MEPAKQIETFKEFFDDVYELALLEAIATDKGFLTAEFSRLAAYNPDLAHDLLEDPENVIRTAIIAAEQVATKHQGPDASVDIEIRFKNLPDSSHIAVGNIRAKELRKLIQVRGIVRQKSDVRPQVTSSKFECPSCGAIIPVLQVDSKFREPTRCSCGRKGQFREVSKQLVDAQKIVLEEASDELEGSEQPKRLNIILKKDLVSPLSDRRTNPGSKIEVVGYLNEIPIQLPQGQGRSTRFDIMMEGIWVEPVEEEFGQITITPQEAAEIETMAKDERIYEKLVESVAPSIYGHERVKEALILQMLGGIKKTRPDGVVTRGDMHILLIGDPGSGKSQLLRRITKVAPKARFVSGKGSSAAGLTASVVKDEFLRGYALEAGALVLANKGFACIDELDKMSPEDRSAFHEALEQQTVTISKANIQATLRCETVVLAAANPKYGRFDPYELLAKQIDLPSTLINRFDLIFPIKDMPNKARDEEMAHFILTMHKEQGIVDVPYETDMLKKYIAYARRHTNPQLSTEALEEIKRFYVTLRSSGNEAEMQSIPISARQLEGLVRLSEASAKSRLSQVITVDDAKRAIDLVYYCLTQIGIDPQTGKLDIDRASGIMPASERNVISKVRDIIKQLSEQTGDSLVPEEDILEQARLDGVDPRKAEEALEKLNQKGDIFRPRHGFYSMMK
jgi:replicative DNA helicase Mcm